MKYISMRTFDFKALPIEIEVKDLKFVKEIPKVVGRPHINHLIL